MFSKVGDVKRIVMGLDKHRLTPCGFCFVVYYTREDTEDCVKYVNGTMLDDRPIRVDFDWGFMEGRQFGRGRSGGQVREGWPRGAGGAGPGRCLPGNRQVRRGSWQPTAQRHASSSCLLHCLLLMSLVPVLPCTAACTAGAR